MERAMTAVARIPASLPLPPPARLAVGYDWFAKANLERALSWAKSLQAPLDAQTRTYFVTAIVDLVHFDKASRGAAALPTKPDPMRQDDLEATIFQGGPYWMINNGRYHLQRKPLEWGPDAPTEALDAFARLTAASPPDRCWIGEYVQERRPIIYDPIIYAEYGDWLVEVARWE